MRNGKLKINELKETIFNTIKHRRDEVEVHSAVGVDCAVLKCDEHILVTTDPITTECSNMGSLVIHINANDIAASGGIPMGANLTLLVPCESSNDVIKDIMVDAEKACEELNIEILSGHTEFTDSVTRPIISCTMIGKAKKLIQGNTAKVGDSIVMTKVAGIEGTLILRDYFKNDLSKFQSDLDYLSNNLSVVKDGQIAQNYDITSMHDVTESGILGAINEMCKGSDLGALIDLDCVPVLPLTTYLCDKYGLTPYKLLSSGSMIITTDSPDDLINELNKNNIKATVIGKITKNNKVLSRSNDKIEEVIISHDEILKVEDK